MTTEYKTSKENYEDLLNEARGMTIRNIKIALKQRNAMHPWAVKAYEDALREMSRKDTIQRRS